MTWCRHIRWTITYRRFVCLYLPNDAILLVFKEGFVFLLTILLCIWLFDYSPRVRYVIEKLSLTIQCQHLLCICLLSSVVIVVVLLCILSTNGILLLYANA